MVLSISNDYLSDFHVAPKRNCALVTAVYHSAKHPLAKNPEIAPTIFGRL